MRKILIISLLIVSAIIFHHCNKNTGIDKLKEITLHRNPYRIEFKKIKQVDLDIIDKTGGYFNKIDIPDCLYIAWHSDKAHEIYKLNDNLNLQDKYAVKIGQGPGEALNLLILTGDKQEIIGYDLMYQRMMFWDINFSNCRMIKKRFWNNEFAHHSIAYNSKTDELMSLEEKDADRDYMKKTLLLTLKKVKGSTKRELIIFKLDIGKVMEARSGQIHLWYARPIHARLHKEYIYILNIKDYIIYKYNLDGKLLDHVKVNFTQQSFSDDQLNRFHNSWYRNNKNKVYNFLHFPDRLWPACWLLPLGNGLLVGRRNDYQISDDEWIECDYFDLNLKYLGKVNIPTFSKWNNPFFCQNTVENKLFSRGDTIYIIENNDDSEITSIHKWIWKNEK